MIKKKIIIPRKKSVKMLIRDADKWFSLFIRLRDSNSMGVGKCVTCNEYAHYLKMDCGHFISRTYFATRFNEKNTALQCKRCNTFGNGEPILFAKAIEDKYGIGTVDKLIIESRKICKRDIEDYNKLIFHYKKLVHEKAQQLGIKIL
jgi:hypothetical protein